MAWSTLVATATSVPHDDDDDDEKLSDLSPYLSRNEVTIK